MNLNKTQPVPVNISVADFVTTLFLSFTWINQMSVSLISISKTSPTLVGSGWFLFTSPTLLAITTPLLAITTNIILLFNYAIPQRVFNEIFFLEYSNESPQK